MNSLLQSYMNTKEDFDDAHSRMFSFIEKKIVPKLHELHNLKSNIHKATGNSYPRPSLNHIENIEVWKDKVSFELEFRGECYDSMTINLGHSWFDDPEKSFLEAKRELEEHLDQQNEKIEQARKEEEAKQEERERALLKELQEKYKTEK